MVLDKKYLSYPYKNFQIALLKYRPETILKKLENAISHDGGIFRENFSFKEFRELSLLFRIDLLLQWGRSAEALAWLCLETELNPNNIEALALKEQLKKQLNFKKDENRYFIKEKNGNKQLFDWGPVAGMRREKAILERDVLLPIKERDLYKKFNVFLPRGILLYGPPGCGKTFLVGQLAKMAGFSFYKITTSVIASTNVHGTQKKIGVLFEEAYKNKPSFVFIDELEALAPNRKRRDVSFHYQSEVNEFLVQLDKAYQRDIFVVAATNHLDMIDEAIRRPGRFDKKLFIGPPDLEARIDMFKHELKNKPHNITRWLYIGEETEGYTYAEIKHVIGETAREVAFSGRPVLNINDLMKVILAHPPGLNKQELEKYYRK